MPQLRATIIVSYDITYDSRGKSPEEEACLVEDAIKDDVHGAIEHGIQEARKAKTGGTISWAVKPIKES